MFAIFHVISQMIMIIFGLTMNISEHSRSQSFANNRGQTMELQGWEKTADLLFM